MARLASMARGMPMVATETMISGSYGRIMSANSCPAVSANSTPMSTQMRSAMVSSSLSAMSGSSTFWLPTVVV